MSGHGGFSRVGGGGGANGEDLLSQQEKVDGGAEFKKESKELAQEFVQNNGIIYGRESERDVKHFFKDAAQIKDGIAVDDNGEIKVKRSVAEKAEALAEKLVDRIRVTDEAKVDTYKDLRGRLKGQYFISKEDMAEYRKYYNEYGNSTVDVSTSARWNTSIDTIYSELYNEGANRFGLTNPNGSAAKLAELNGALRSLREGMRVGIDSDAGRNAYGGASRKEIVRTVRDALIESAGMAQVFFDSTPKEKRGKKK